MTDTLKTLAVSSPDFEDQKSMPIRHTARGENLSPEIAWSGAPEGTVSFALVTDDPDAPSPKLPLLTWVHWVCYNIPPEITSLERGRPHGRNLPGGGLQAKNSFRKLGYNGPDPPFGEHRYRFKVYALDCMLDLDPEKSGKKAVEKAMAGHILAWGELVGLFKK